MPDYQDWPWTPQDWEDLPHRVRDNEEMINQLKRGQDQLNSKAKWMVGGIWAIVAQGLGAALTFWLTQGAG